MYRPGAENSPADYLSRPCKPAEQVFVLNIEPHLQNVARYLETSTLPEHLDRKAIRGTKFQARLFVHHDGQLYRTMQNGSRLVPDINTRSDILKCLHDEAGHWGFTSLYQMIADRFWWPGMRKQISDFVKTCDACQKAKPNTRYRSGARMPISGLFHTWSVDFTGPLPITKNHKKYLIVAVEHMSGWPVARASVAADSSVVVAFLRQEILNTFGIPGCVMSDNGAHFAATYVKEFAEASGFKWKFVSAYNPRGNGKVERMIGTLKVSLKKTCLESQTDWDTKLPRILNGYRQRPNADGISPFCVMFGVEPRTRWEQGVSIARPENTMAIRKAELARAGNLRVDRLMPYVEPEGRPFRKHEFVLLRRGVEPKGSRFSSWMWTGPYKIIEADHPRYRLENTNRRRTRRTVHARRLRRYHVRGSPQDAGGEINQ